MIKAGWRRFTFPCHCSDYLYGSIPRSRLYSLVPSHYINSVINAEISRETLPAIFRETDELLNGARLDLIIGGPPCQAYSIVGRSKDRNRMKGDRRNYLYVYYTEFLKRYRPSWFVFENVTGLLSAKDENGNLYLDNMRQLFRGAGYETEFMALSAEEYGVLQSRNKDHPGWGPAHALELGQATGPPGVLFSGYNIPSPSFAIICPWKTRRTNTHLSLATLSIFNAGTGSALRVCPVSQGIADLV